MDTQQKIRDKRRYNNKIMKKISLMLIVMVVAIAGFAKNETTQENYNIRRALELAANDENASAVDYLDKEMEENPKNAYAYLMKAAINNDYGYYDESVELIEKSLKLIPKKNKDLMSYAYELQGKTRLAMSDTVGAITSLEEAVKLKPENDDALEELAGIYYHKNDYDRSDEYYRRMLKLDSSNIMAYMGLGRNESDRGNHDAAISHFSKVIDMASDYSSGYSFRAESYIDQENYVKAADDIMMALKIDDDSRAYLLMFLFPQEQLPLLEAKLKTLAISDPYEPRWPVYTGDVFAVAHQPEKALDYYKKGVRMDANDVIYKRIANCYEAMGMFQDAIRAIRNARLIDDEPYYEMEECLYTEYAGDYDGALALWDKVIEKNPDLGYPYYRKGYIYHLLERPDDAIDALSMSLLLEPDYQHALLSRGDAFMRKNDREAAMKDYRRITEIDTVPNGDSCAMYAWLALGDKEKAKDFMAQAIEADPDDYGNYYDAACLYCRMGDTDRSMEFLLQAIDKGFRRLNLILKDDDLAPLRQTEAFRKYYEVHESEFQPQREAEVEPAPAAPLERVEEGVTASRVEVPFTPSAGCASVKCTINSLPLTFIFDTGASTVSLSQVEANFMLKNGYLKKEDIIGSGRFVDANGDVSEGTIINLRDVEFGGLKLENVRASVVRNQKAPLLLGQSVLSRLGKIEIDNGEGVLRITPVR